MFWFVPYISDPVWDFTYVAYSLTSSKPANNTKGRCFWHTLSDNCIFSQLYSKWLYIILNTYEHMSTFCIVVTADIIMNVYLLLPIEGP
jgi:hypothetical protein